MAECRDIDLCSGKSGLKAAVRDELHEEVKHQRGKKGNGKMEEGEVRRDYMEIKRGGVRQSVKSQIYDAVNGGSCAYEGCTAGRQVYGEIKVQGIACRKTKVGANIARY